MHSVFCCFFLCRVRHFTLIYFIINSALTHVEKTHNSLIFLYFLPFLTSGCRGQSMESILPSPLVKMLGETISLSCRGSGFTFCSFWMNWVKQPAGKWLEWMGCVYTNGHNTNYSSSFQDSVEISRDNSNSMVYLSLSNLRPDDSAVYYCARKDSTVIKMEGEAKKNSSKLFSHGTQGGSK